MGKVKVQGKIMDVRASNAGNAYKDQLYTATNGMLYDKERFIDIQLFHKGIGERGENIKMINQGLKGEIDEFGYGQRITQPFIAQSLMDRQKQRETQREIETDMITQGKINLLRQQGLLRDEERLGTFLPSGRNGMRKEIPAVEREAVEDRRMVGELADRLRRAREDLIRASGDLQPSEEQMLTQEERLRREDRIKRGRELFERLTRPAPDVRLTQEQQETLSSLLPGAESDVSELSSSQQSELEALRRRAVPYRIDPSDRDTPRRADLPFRQETQEIRRIPLPMRPERTTRMDAPDPLERPFSLFG